MPSSFRWRPHRPRHAAALLLSLRSSARPSVWVHAFARALSIREKNNPAQPAHPRRRSLLLGRARPVRSPLDSHFPPHLTRMHPAWAVSAAVAHREWRSAALLADGQLAQVCGLGPAPPPRRLAALTAHWPHRWRTPRHPGPVTALSCCLTTLVRGHVRAWPQVRAPSARTHRAAHAEVRLAAWRRVAVA